MADQSDTNPIDYYREYFGCREPTRGDQDGTGSDPADDGDTGSYGVVIAEYCNQQDSFWAMFYAEFFRFVNYQIMNNKLLLPTKFGFEWCDQDVILSLPYGKGLGEMHKLNSWRLTANPDVASFVATMSQFWEVSRVVIDNTHCVLRPVGAQHRFIENAHAIGVVLCSSVEFVCGPESFIGRCSIFSGGATFKTSGLHRDVVRILSLIKKSKKSECGAYARIPKHARHNYVAQMFRLRDMLINLKQIFTQAVAFTSAIRSAVQGLQVYSAQTMETAAKEDPVHYGYRIRECDVLRTNSDPSEMKCLTFRDFDFMSFAVCLGQCTSVYYYQYLPPHYTLASFVRATLAAGENPKNVIDCWTHNANNLLPDSIGLVSNRCMAEWGQYRQKVPKVAPVYDDEFEFNTLGRLASVAFRGIYNLPFHSATTTVAIEREGDDDFHSDRGETPMKLALENHFAKLFVRAGADHEIADPMVLTILSEDSTPEVEVACKAEAELLAMEAKEAEQRERAAKAAQRRALRHKKTREKRAHAATKMQGVAKGFLARRAAGRANSAARVIQLLWRRALIRTFFNPDRHYLIEQLKRRLLVAESKARDKAALLITRWSKSCLLHRKLLRCREHEARSQAARVITRWAKRTQRRHRLLLCAMGQKRTEARRGAGCVLVSWARRCLRKKVLRSVVAAASAVVAGIRRDAWEFHHHTDARFREVYARTNHIARERDALAAEVRGLRERQAAMAKEREALLELSRKNSDTMHKLASRIAQGARSAKATDPALLRLQCQVEWFVVHNFDNDVYMQEHLDPNGNVPIALLATFPTIKAITGKRDAFQMIRRAVQHSNFMALVANDSIASTLF